VMLGSSRRGAGHALGCREADCDISASRTAQPVVLLPLFQFHPKSIILRRH
jgi:hypothetical protein